MRVIGVSVVVIAASWLVLALNGGPNVSNAHLAISVGGGLGSVMLLNTWGVIWRVQKRLIAWARTSAEQGVAMPPEAERLMRWNYLTARTSFWLSFPMRSEEHTSELQSRLHLVCRLLLEKKKNTKVYTIAIDCERVIDSN